MLTLFARLRKFFATRTPTAVPAWMQAIGVELQLRYDMGREPMPETMEDALSKMSDPKKRRLEQPHPSAAAASPAEPSAVSGAEQHDATGHERAA